MQDERVHVFVEEVCEQVKVKLIRNEIREELQNHIEDRKDEYMKQGIAQEMAVEKAIHSMGEPLEIGLEYNKRYHTQVPWSVYIPLFLYFLVSKVMHGYSICIVPNRGGLENTNNINAIRSDVIFSLGLFIIILAIIQFGIPCIIKHPVWMGLALITYIMIPSVYALVKYELFAGYVFARLLLYTFVPLIALLLYKSASKKVYGLTAAFIALAVSMIYLIVTYVVMSKLTNRHSNLQELTFASAFLITIHLTVYMGIKKGIWGNSNTHIFKTILLAAGVVIVMTMVLIYIKTPDFFINQSDVTGEDMLKYSPPDIGSTLFGKSLILLRFAIEGLILIKLFHIISNLRNKLGFLIAFASGTMMAFRIIPLLIRIFNYGIFLSNTYNYGNSLILVDMIYIGLICSAYRYDSVLRVARYSKVNLYKKRIRIE